MLAKISKVSGNTAVIVIDNLYAYLIDANDLPSLKVGNSVDIPTELLERATPYGIDLEVAFPDGISIDPLVVQSKLYAAGVVSLDDLKRDPSAINRALQSMIGVLSANMYRDIKISMEDYNVI